MANTKISALPAGAPAQATDVIPVDRAGTNVSLTVANVQAGLVPTSTTVNGHALSSNVVVSASDLTTGTLGLAEGGTNADLSASGSDTAILAQDASHVISARSLVSGDIPSNAANTSGTAANLSGTPALPNGTTATTQAATDSSTKLATTAAIAAQIVDGVPAANSIAKIVASRVLVGQTTVDGNATQTLYTATAAGVYRVSAGIVARTKSSTGWVINVEITLPSGFNDIAQVLQSMDQSTGHSATSPFSQTKYYHLNDVVTCGTVTGSGSNSGGAFDVVWIVERVA